MSKKEVKTPSQCKCQHSSPNRDRIALRYFIVSSYSSLIDIDVCTIRFVLEILGYGVSSETEVMVLYVIKGGLLNDSR